MNAKKLLALTLALVLALGLLAGCGGSTTPAADSGNSNQPTSSGGDATPAPVKEGVENIVVEVINFGYVDPDLQSVENAINAISEEKIGVHVTLMCVPIMDMATKLGLMVAGNEQIDMVATGLLTSPAQLSSQGLLMPLDDLIAGSEILSAKGGSMLEACKVNGTLYAYPGGLYPGKGLALFYDKDLAEQYGIQMPERVNSADDFGAIFQQVVDSGMPQYAVSMGDGVNAELSYNVIEDLGDPTYLSYGVVLDPFAGSKVENWYESEAYEHEIRRAQEWFEKGYCLPDSLSNGVTTHASMEAGQCFSFFSAYTTGTEEGYWSQSTHKNVGSVHFDQTYISSAGVVQTSWGIASSSQHAEAVIKFAELIYGDPEVGTLYRYGVEGQNWVKKEGTQNVIRYPDGKDSTNVGYGSFIPFFGDEAELPVLEPKDDSFYAVIDSMSAKNAKPFKFMGYSFDPSNVMAEVTAVQAVISKYGPALNVGATDVDSMWPKFIQDMKDAGIDTIIAENQKQVEAWLAGK